MAGLLTHLKVSAIPDGPDPAQVNPSDWNASHVFTGGALGSLLIRDTADPTYGASWLPAVAAGQVLIANGVAALPTWSASPTVAGLTVSGAAGVGGDVSVGGSLSFPTNAAGPFALGPSIFRTADQLYMRVGSSAYALVVQDATGGATSLLVLTNTGLLTVNGFGTHSFSAGGTGEQQLLIRNATPGAGNYASLALGNDTAAATGLLQVFASNSAIGAPYRPDGVALRATQAGGISLLAEHGLGKIHFYTAAAPRGFIEADGRWALGSALAPDANSTVTIRSIPNRQALRVEAETAGFTALSGLHSANGATSYVAYLQNTGSGTGVYLSNTSAWVAISDRRRKTDIRDLDVLAGLRTVQPRDFLWQTHAASDQPGQRQYGFIAQEVQDVFPNLITPSPDGLLGVNYDGFIAPLVQGWQAHDRRLARLESLVTERT
jgi:hypothetical protein